MLTLINSREDLDNAPDDVRELYMVRLAAGINRWVWQGGDWVLVQDTSTIERYGFTLEDFSDAPTPDKPTNNPDEDAKAQARASASLTPAEFQLALLAIGELDNVEAAIPQSPREVQILWNKAQKFERMHPALVELGNQMGYTDEQMDALFGVE